SRTSSSLSSIATALGSVQVTLATISRPWLDCKCLLLKGASVDFSLDDDQEMLAASAAALARDIAKAMPRLDVGAVPAAANDHRLAAIEEAWRQLSDLGLVGLLVPEEHGGGGATLLEAAIVAEALAYELLPVPS